VTIYEGINFTVPSDYEPNLSPGPTTGTRTRGSMPSDAKYQNLPHAVLEFDSSQIHKKAVSGTIKNPVWENEGGLSWTRKFDVFRASDLTIRLYIKHRHTREGNQHIFLGAAKITPAFESDFTSQMKWLQIGTGKLHVRLEYTKKNTLQIRTTKRARCYKDGYVDSISRIWKWDTLASYGSVNIQKSVNLSQSDVVRALLSPVNNNPFIAPLKFAAQTETKLCLFWPFISGGYLLYHLQMAQRFQIDRARLYTAEILVALESLHTLDPSYHLDPSNLFLDSTGHILLWDLDLLRLEIDNTEVESDMPEDDVAPELLTSKDSTRTFSTASKWWTLGALLYEMLIGLPPFYSEDVQERRRNILFKPLEMSRLLPASARDLLAKLLNRNPEERLGVNGPSEIKSHPFFDEIDWTKVSRREYEPIFSPPELTISFSQKRRRTKAEFIHLFDDFDYKGPKNSTTLPSTAAIHQPAVVPANTESHRVATQSISVNVEKKEDWELIWHTEDRIFYFFNSSTSDRRPIAALLQKHMPPMMQQQSQAVSDTRQDESANSHRSPDANVHDLPNAAQIQGALDAMLKNEYLHLVHGLLKQYSINLNVDLSFTSQTPLEYVTELGDVKIVELFLDHGADANASVQRSYTLGGLPLLYAVQQGNHELVEILVRKTDRVPSTRALGHAITKRNISIINILLANEVRCDFEDSDRPLSSVVPDHEGGVELDTWSMTCGDRSEPAEYLPPLIRAVILSDEELVRLLLAHGANINIGFHDLDMHLLPDHWPIDISCGRPIQLALELGHHNLVRLLLDNGADIDIAQPVLQHHNCEMIPRVAYHQIISRLRSLTSSAAAASDMTVFTSNLYI
jgi:serum/glucocorticoid-regulated kinase 2